MTCRLTARPLAENVVRLWEERYPMSVETAAWLAWAMNVNPRITELIEEADTLIEEDKDG